MPSALGGNKSQYNVNSISQPPGQKGPPVQAPPSQYQSQRVYNDAPPPPRSDYASSDAGSRTTRDRRERRDSRSSRGSRAREVVPLPNQFDQFDRAPEDRHKEGCGGARKLNHITDFFGAYEPVVRGSLHIEGVNYAKYEAQKHRQGHVAAFLDALRDDIISEIGNGVRREDILLHLYPGAIKTVVLHYDRFDGPEEREVGDPKLVDAEWNVKCDYAIRARDVQRQQNIAIALYTALGEEQMFSTHKMKDVYVRRFDKGANHNKIAIVKPPQEAEQMMGNMQNMIMPQRAPLPSPPRPMNSQLITSPMQQQQQQQMALTQMPYETPPRMQQQQAVPQPSPHPQMQMQLNTSGDVFDTSSARGDSAAGLPMHASTNSQQQQMPYVPASSTAPMNQSMNMTGMTTTGYQGMSSMGAGPSGMAQPSLMHNAPVGQDGWMEMNGKRGVAVFIPEDALMSTPQSYNRVSQQSFQKPNESPYGSMTKTPPSLLAP